MQSFIARIQSSGRGHAVRTVDGDNQKVQLNTIIASLRSEPMNYIKELSMVLAGAWINCFVKLSLPAWDQ